MNSSTPVSRSTAKHHSDKYNPPESEIIGLEYGRAANQRFSLDNSRNEYAWIDARDDGSFVDLDEMR